MNDRVREVHRGLASGPLARVMLAVEQHLGLVLLHGRIVAYLDGVEIAAAVGRPDAVEHHDVRVVSRPAAHRRLHLIIRLVLPVRHQLALARVNVVIDNRHRQATALHAGEVRPVEKQVIRHARLRAGNVNRRALERNRGGQLAVVARPDPHQHRAGNRRARGANQHKHEQNLAQRPTGHATSCYDWLDKADGSPVRRTLLIRGDMAFPAYTIP